jgi:hypothetical protein
MQIRYTAVWLALFMSLCAAPAMAAESGIYIGGGVGGSTFKDDVPVIGDIDEDDLAWKAFLGYRLGGFIPILDLAAELTYRDFGNPDGFNFKYDATGYDASLLGIFALGPVDLFARAGVGNYSIEKTVNNVHSDDDSTSGLFGVGAGLRLGKLAVRVEWERVEPDGVDHIDMYTVNAYWRF